MSHTRDLLVRFVLIGLFIAGLGVPPGAAQGVIKIGNLVDLTGPTFCCSSSTVLLPISVQTACIKAGATSPSTWATGGGSTAKSGWRWRNAAT